jgi:uncharacterized protein
MTESRPTLIPSRLPKQGAQWQGTLSARGFERLADALVGDGGAVTWQVRAVPAALGKVRMHCTISGFLRLAVHGGEPDQSFDWPFDITRRMTLVGRESDLPAIEDEPDDEDFLLAEPRMDLLELIEDELLLSLPMVPTRSETAPETPKPSPFAALAALKH